MQKTQIYCARCGSQLAEGARFCVNCGQPVAFERETIALRDHPVSPPVVPQYAQYPQYTQPSQYSLDERNYAMYCHLSTLLGWLIPLGDLILTLVLWSTWRERSSFVDAHGREALNYQLNFYFWATIFALLSCFFIGIPFLIVLALIDVIVPIIAAVKASKGESFRYPAIIRFVK